MRMRAIDAAIRKGQIGSAQLLMRDLGAVVGEVAPEAMAAAAPQLTITVEDKRQAWSAAADVTKCEAWSAASSQFGF
jgi:hypothetical protein